MDVSLTGEKSDKAPLSHCILHHYNDILERNKLECTFRSSWRYCNVMHATSAIACVYSLVCGSIQWNEDVN